MRPTKGLTPAWLGASNRSMQKDAMRTIPSGQEGSGPSAEPPDQSRAVADAAGRLVRAVEVPGADHNDAVLLDGTEVVRAVLDLAT